MALPAEEVKRRFPDFPGVKTALEVTVTAGQMLYLPAGWFHEVTSSSSRPGEPHMAVNYWFHPPDNLGRVNYGTKEHPYKSDFWPSLWNERVRHHQWPPAMRVPERGPSSEGSPSELHFLKRQASASAEGEAPVAIKRSRACSG
jgi:hypothetical protein